MVAKKKLSVPIVANGGINAENGAALIRAGADMIAACSGVFDHRDPQSAAHHYAMLFTETSLG